MDIPQIGIGTYKLDPETTYQVVLEGLKLGYRHIDTAALYRNEEAVKKAILDSGIPRPEIFVTTKILRNDIEKWKVREGFLESLEKLGKIDLVLLHCPTPGWKNGWKELIKLQKDKLVTHIGVSNFRLNELEDIVTDFEIKPYCNQIEITPFLLREDVAQYCEEQKIRIVAHSSLTKKHGFKSESLIKIAKKLSSTPPQILISWSVQKGYCVLPRTSDLLHLKENRNIIGIPLSVMRELDNMNEVIITHRRWS